ncbi:MAG: DUF4366 domain-containing protein [Oscillospiraceae bacterium]|nr:DUF4366 domain-containing protein [Oscillospiraceae bacterium]
MNRFRILTASAAVVFCMTALSVPAFAQSNEPVEEPTPQPAAAVEPNPLTPDGTGTVLDSTTEADGKQFYTITTPAGNTFYLIIDGQRDSQNVYFLDTAQEKDLLALAEADEQDVTGVTGETAEEPQAEDAPEPTTEPEAEQPDVEKPVAAAQSSRIGMIVILVIVALAAGGVGYYFKIVKPKKALDDADDFDEIEFEDSPEINEDEAPESLPEPDNAAELEDDAK